VRYTTLLWVSLLAGACADSTRESTAIAPAAAPVAVITLPLRSDGQPAETPPTQVTILASAAQVRIELPGAWPPADELTAELEARESGEVRRWPVDTVADGVAVMVPVYAIPAGEHVLTLWRGDAEIVGRHAFRRLPQ
jgi:hypothetical protein